MAVRLARRKGAAVTAAATTPTPPGTLRPCDGSGTHGWVEPDVWLTTDPRRAAWTGPACGLAWRLGKEQR
jgi:hypothetical protein